MRFELNKKYPFVCVQFSTAHRQFLNGMASSIFQPWEHALLGIEVRMLTCVEHHKVPNEWDSSNPPKLDCDGFIFLDEETEIRWSNQYPRASYGQTTDTADRIVMRMFPEGTDYKALPDDMVFEMELATHRVERIENALYDSQAVIEKIEAGVDVEKYLPVEEVRRNRQALANFRDILKDAIEKVAGRKLVIAPLTYGPTKKVLDGCFRARFEGEEDDSHML
jgi:hypothetical protein